MGVYLGLDSSTQSLTAILIQVDGDERRVLFESSIRFDEDLSEYGTKNGVLESPDPLVAHSSPILWADALDRMMAQLTSADLPLHDLRAIAGSGQQHGSVYLNGNWGDAVSSLNPSGSLVDQIGDVFSRATAPIWMDSSTRAQCDEISDALGGGGALAELTGSIAFERFTGPQIRKFWQDDPSAYENTARIHLVSSYLASLLAGKDACIEPGDAAGMNLMNLRGSDWADAALEATAPDLRRRLPTIEASSHVNGTLAPYWVEKYGLPASTRVVSWSGDNPCSLIGVGLVEAGRIAISLGTSDTLFGFLPEAKVDPAGEGHTFGSPTGHYMSLICFKNGSIARENVRRQYDLDWEAFSDALRSTPKGNGGAIMLPWFEPEITPNVLEAGVRRYGLDENDAASNVRAVVEAQMLSMAQHSAWMDVDFVQIYATGGAAANREILQVMANVHNADVFQFPVGNSAALGAALRAFHGDELSRGAGAVWTDIVAGFAEPVRESCIKPEPGAHELYKNLRSVYSACEKHALDGGPDPKAVQEDFVRRFGAG